METPSLTVQSGTTMEHTCDTCNHYESLQSTSEEFQKWKASEDYAKWENDHLDGSVNCNCVIKLDCIGVLYELTVTTEPARKRKKK